MRRWSIFDKGHIAPRHEGEAGYVQYHFRIARTPEQLAEYYSLQQPNPKHVSHLKAGIAEFRQMLEKWDK
jgi:hypothetical protein